MGKKKQALGRGLDALLSDASTDVTSSIKIDDSNHKAVGNISNIKLSQIEVNPFNSCDYLLGNYQCNFQHSRASA